MEPTIYKPSIYKGAGIYKTGEEGGGGGLKYNRNFTFSPYSQVISGMTLDMENHTLTKNDSSRDIYLSIPNPHFENYENVEICFKFKKNNISNPYPQIFGEDNTFWKQPCVWFTDGTKINVGVPSGNDNWDNLFTFNGITDGTIYKIKAIINNLTKICICTLYDENGDVINEETKTFSTISYRDVAAFLFFSSNASYDHVFNGVIYLDDSYIKGDDTLIW